MKSYTYRLAKDTDVREVADLWSAFAKEQEQGNPSIIINQEFNFEDYVQHQFSNNLTYCWVLEQNNENSLNDEPIVGFLLGRYYDETPPPSLSQTLLERHRLNHPYQYRRVGSVLALYIQPEHRSPESITLLIDAALQHAEFMKVTDIDLMIGAQLSGLQSFLERIGFTRTAIQYTRHYNIQEDTELPNLHPSASKNKNSELSRPQAIPLRDPKTSELIKGPQGNPVFLSPLEAVSQGEGPQLPIYPTPVRDPQTQSFVFDPNGELVVCPILRDETDNIFTHKGIPQFKPPAYEYVHGKLQLKQDPKGNYIFCDAEHDATGAILCDQQGKPIFQNPLNQFKAMTP